MPNSCRRKWMCRPSFLFWYSIYNNKNWCEILACCDLVDNVFKVDEKHKACLWMLIYSLYEPTGRCLSGALNCKTGDLSFWFANWTECRHCLWPSVSWTLQLPAVPAGKNQNLSTCTEAAVEFEQWDSSFLAPGCVGKMVIIWQKEKAKPV